MDWTMTSNVSSLLEMSVQSVVKNLRRYWSCLDVLPSNLRDRCLYLMSKRGLLTDTNIKKVLHDKLTILDLSESNITDEALHFTHRCPNLRKIDLNVTKGSRPEITTEGIKSITSSCPHLQTLHLRRCINITDEAIVSLASRCPQLQALNVGGCYQLTDHSLKALGQHCQYLKCIIFSKTKVTDDGVFDLVSGRCSDVLQEINMDTCISLTDEAVEAVIQYCPNISILIFHGCPNITEQSRLSLEEFQRSPTSKMKQLTWTVY